ncbi:atp dependent dna ligase domain protein [Ophiostoma piceae UAMH 11346]|uniref:Atp dependent dna ligase domain protein n=1 Tax=Ophiostoma piceae (strain UAMH 11346) TaxID=1262450 RepID=S3BNE8_OPHP1|nr:atp dependent dna ligase domain protein [Ophiostoma piceae UAMH 11346]
MPFPFSHVCDLLQQTSDLPPLRRNQTRVVNQIVYSWFCKHRQAIDQLGEDVSSAKPAVALLSTLLPERRPDRVYGLQARGLQRILVRILGLGHSRAAELSRWERPVEYGEAVDLADCVEAILLRTPNPATAHPVTVEEIDAVLEIVASRCRFSAPSIRQNDDVSSPTQAALGGLYQRLDACGAKWLTRLILKDFRPAVLDGTTVARAFHPWLPMALQVNSSLDAAVSSLLQTGSDTDGTPTFKPSLGVKIGRQQWAKGRSIEHCIEMGGPQRMSCERKMDGEYVQVHVDLTRGEKDCLQLFSKSGKDSTWDRVNLHGAVRESLRIGRSDCKLSTGCILEGEMLAYDDRECKILDFDAIRKHVNRSGSKIFNTKEETQDHEHLMIVYYDVLLIDDESLLGTRHADRFRRLEDLIACRQGYAELVQREVIDFGSRKAASQLRQAFAKCITARLEGLVIKPDNDPYFDFAAGHNTAALQWPYLRSYCIKLKKEYIGTFGEVGDFAVVGGRYDATKAMEYPPDSLPGRVRWTHFFIGCLDRAKSTPTRPHFVVTNVVTLTVAQMATFLTHCRPRVVPYEPTQNKNKTKTKNKNRGTERIDLAEAPFDLARIEPGIDGCKGGPTELFADPPVVDIRCFSFHRQGYGRFWSPRFPGVVKFHFDRTFRDAMTFEALQTLAEEESSRRAELADEEGDNSVQYYDDTTENAGNEQNEKNEDERAHWVDQLKKADRRGIAVDAETSQSSGPTTATTARSQSSASASQFSLSSMPNTHAQLLDDLHTQYDTHELYEIHEIEEIEEMDENDKEDRGGRTVRESSQISELSIATVKSPEVRRVRQMTATVIDLTGDDDDEDEKEDVKEDENWQSVREDDEYDSDESQQGIARLYAQEEARLSQPSQLSQPSLPASLPPPVITTSPPSTPPRSSPVPDMLSSSPVEPASSMTTCASQVASQPNSSQQQRPTPKRLRTWDVASMYPAISPPALKRARSGI